MVPSVDGRIVTERWKLPPAVYGEYERTARTFNADAPLRLRVGPGAGTPHEAPLRREARGGPLVGAVRNEGRRGGSDTEEKSTAWLQSLTSLRCLSPPEEGYFNWLSLLPRRL